MFESIKRFFRKKALKKYASTVPTGILPLKDIKTAVALIDVEDQSFDSCKESIISFYRENGIKGEIFFLDFRKISSNERLITSITNTLLKKDFSWFGRLCDEKTALLNASNPDVFISLVSSDGFPLEFIASASKARFKIGRTQLPGGVFDLVISEPEGTSLPQTDIFAGVKKYLKVIG